MSRTELRLSSIRPAFCALATASALLALTPVTAGAESLVLRGGTIHSLVAPPQAGSVLIEDGIIREVGASVSAPAGARILDISGQHVYPGLFDALTQMGLVEIDSISATVDTSEIGKYNPQLLAATAVHPASEVIGVTRSNGITHAVTAPAADGDGVIAGQAALLSLDGWTVEEMLIDPRLAMVISWPAIQTRRFDFATFSVRSSNYTEAKKKADESQEELRQWLDAARHYEKAIDASTARAHRDLKLEALGQILDGGQPVVILADAKRDIEAAVAFAEEQGLQMILGGGRDAWMVTELLVSKKIPVLLGLVQSLPNEDDEPYDKPFSAPAELSAAGVRFAFVTGLGGGGSPSGPHSSRVLPYEAATAAAYGLSREEALKAITLYPAEIFGVADKVGSIEPGKLANLMVTDGDPLEITTQVKHLIIQGREVSTNNRHQALYERYRAR